MGRPIGRLHQDDVRKKFYVYDVLDECGSLIYVGKGSGNRMIVSMRARKGSTCKIVESFSKERDAYAFEVKRIAELCPPLNIAKGGNGAKAAKTINKLPLWAKRMEEIGSRKYAARLWLNCLESSIKSGCKFLGDSSKLEYVRLVAYG